MRKLDSRKSAHAYKFGGNNQQQDHPFFGIQMIEEEHNQDTLLDQIENAFRAFLIQEEPNTRLAELEAQLAIPLRSIRQGSLESSKSLKRTMDEEESDIEALDLPVLDNLATVWRTMKRIEDMKKGYIPQSNIDEIFEQHKTSQEERITKRKLQLEKNEISLLTISPNWSLDYLKFNLNMRDLETLTPNGDLNDNIVNFFLKLLFEHIIDEDLRKKSHYFNTYFMSYLIGSNQIHNEYYMFKVLKAVPSNFYYKVQRNYQKVKKWAKFDIFSKDIIIIPINMPHHWSLIIVLRLPGLFDFSKGKPQIIYLDSMGEKNKAIVQAVRIYLVQELRNKGYHKACLIINEDTLPDYQLLLPRQTNLHDCGLYILTYAQRILLNKQVRETDFSIPQNRVKLNLFPRSLIFTMRYHIVKMLIALSEKQEIVNIIEDYLYQRQRLIKQAIQIDYDEIDHKRFEKYLQICKKKPINQHEKIDSKIGFYLNFDINFFEKNKK